MLFKEKELKGEYHDHGPRGLAAVLVRLVLSEEGKLTLHKEEDDWESRPIEGFEGVQQEGAFG